MVSKAAFETQLDECIFKADIMTLERGLEAGNTDFDTTICSSELVPSV